MLAAESSSRNNFLELKHNSYPYLDCSSVVISPSRFHVKLTFIFLCPLRDPLAGAVPGRTHIPAVQRQVPPQVALQVLDPALILLEAPLDEVIVDTAAAVTAEGGVRAAEATVVVEVAVALSRLVEGVLV